MHATTRVRPASPLIKKQQSVHFEDAENASKFKLKHHFDFSGAADIIPSPLKASDLLQPNARPKSGALYQPSPVKSNALTRPFSSKSSPQETASWQVGDRLSMDPFGDATVAFVGETQFKEGIWIGLKLNSSQHGKNNGTVQGYASSFVLYHTVLC